VKKAWIPLLFVVCTLLLVAVANWWIYQRIESALDENLGSRLSSVVRVLLASNTVMGDVLIGDEGGFDQTSLGLIDEVLKQVERENDLDAILLLDPVDYEVGYSSSELYALGVPYPHLEAHGEAILEAVASSTVTVSSTIRVGSLYLKNGFAPVVTLLGDEALVGILVVEASADFFGVLATVRGVMVSGTAAAALLLLLLVITYFGLQNQIQQAQRSLEREDRMAALGRLASQVAHEIRNPVQIIKLSATRMSKWLTDQQGGRRNEDPELIEMVQYIKEETERLHDLTERYLTYTRHGEIRLSPALPVELVESVASALRKMTLPDGVEVMVEVDSDIPQISCDPDQMRQALLNLASNALEAIETTGRVTLFAAVRRHAGEHDRRSVAAHAVCLGVEDTGPGIPEKIREKIFEPLYSTKEEGNGLGLYIVDGIVRAHGGTIEVESVEGRGARIVIVLPLPANT
jgi:signal transduction histidine kinase